MSNELRIASKIEDVRVLVVGDVMLDRYLYGDVKRISAEAPVPVVSASSEEFRLGGAANVARNVRSLGAQAKLLGVIGRGSSSATLRDLLDSVGINFEDVSTPSDDTTVKFRVIGNMQQMLRIDFDHIVNEKTAGDVLHRFQTEVHSSDVVVCSDYGKGALRFVSDIVSLATSLGKIVVVDPKGSDFERYFGSTLITPNKSELQAVVGKWADEDDLFSKAEKLRNRLKIKGLLLTRSEEGMTLFTSERAESVRATAREVKDVTGAGDTVVAVFSVMVGCGLSLFDSMRIANLAGGKAVERFGTSAVTLDDLAL